MCKLTAVKFRCGGLGAIARFCKVWSKFISFWKRVNSDKDKALTSQVLTLL